MKYTKEHEWLKMDGLIATVGITSHAAEQLGDLVFVELPTEKKLVSSGEEIVVIESVKAASDIQAPADGTIVEINKNIVEDPNLVNSDPLGEGWFFKMEIKDPSVLDEMMDENEYLSFIS